MKEFVVLRAKIYSYLKTNNDEDKKGKGPKSTKNNNLNFKIIKTV